MGVDGEVLVARQLTMLLTNRSQFEQLEEAYCRLRPRHSPTAAVASALSELLPSSEHDVIVDFISGEEEEAYGPDDLPPVHHSFIAGLEYLYEERQTSERHGQRERMDAVNLAADLAADSQLAVAYWEGRHEAARWLERFSSRVLGQASVSPTRTGQRLVVDQALETLRTIKTDYQARGDDVADAQVAWCVALQDQLTASSPHSGDGWGDRSTEGRASDEVDDPIRTVPSAGTIPSPPILDLLRSASSSLADEDRFTALIEAANGHDDDYDPVDDGTVEAMRSLLEEDVLESGDRARADIGGRVRNELWTHMVFGHRVGRYLLMSHSRRSSSPEPRSRSCSASALVAYVGRARRRQDVVDIMSAPDFSAALHYHALSSALLRACGEDRTQARAWVRLVEDVGFLTALGAEDLPRGAKVQVDEERPWV